MKRAVSLVGTAFADTNTTASTTAATQNQALAASGLSPEQIIQNNLGQLPGISKWEFRQRATTPNSVNSAAAQVSLPGLWEGEALITADAAVSSLGSLGHAAIVDNAAYNLSSFPSGGATYYPNSAWSSYSSVGIVGGSGKGQAAVDDLLDKHYLGVGYNYAFWDKWTTGAFYCSQLVWRGFFDVGLNLDPGYPYIAPKQIWDNTTALPKTYFNYNMGTR